MSLELVKVTDKNEIKENESIISKVRNEVNETMKAYPIFAY